MMSKMKERIGEVVWIAKVVIGIGVLLIRNWWVKKKSRGLFEDNKPQ